MTDAELRQRCHAILPGHRQPTPAQAFSAMAAWCEAKHIAHDVYGDGQVVQDFERKVADLLGFEAAVFCISGTMAQSVALRLACEDRASTLVALHPTSHIIVHEKSNHQLLGHFSALQVGDRHRPWSVDDLQAVPDRLGAIAMEVPMREIGGQNPSWEQLELIKSHARGRGVHLHMDGARLWEAAAACGRSWKDMAAGFDSVYVSLYKGIGGLGGAMLLGDTGFIARAAEWFRRQGGNVIHRLPYVVSAAMQFDARLQAMPDYFHRTQWLYQQLRAYPLIKPNPAAPQANMLHLHLPVSRERAIGIRDAIAAEHGIWLFGRAVHAPLPGTCMTELYIGDNLLGMPDQQVHEALGLLSQALAT